MKVLIFTTQFYQLGGAERLAVELAQELNRQSIHADILSMYTDDLPGVAEARDALIASGIPEVKFLGLRPFSPIIHAIPAILKLRRLVREGGYDVVETSSISTAIIAAWALFAMKVRHVAGIHDIIGPDIENTRQHRMLRRSLPFHPRLRYYAISDRAAEHWLSYVRIARGRTRRIYNAIADEAFLAVPDRLGVCNELGIPAKGRLVLFVGRLAVRKGVDTLLDAVAPILKDHDAYLLLAGAADLSIPGSDEMLRHVEQFIAEKGLGDRVRFLGFRRDVSRLLASCDLMVHPARIEAFGLVLGEAMAAGIPVVASDVDGIPEILAGTDSVMVPPNNAPALRAAILTVLARSPDDKARARQKGLARASDFRLSKRGKAMTALFEDVVSGRF